MLLVGVVMPPIAGGVQPVGRSASSECFGVSVPEGGL